MPGSKVNAVEGDKPASTRKQQAEQARARIIDAALTLFAARGFEGASMPQIAKLADASVPLLVYHFGNKESLWKATIEKSVEQFDSRLNDLLQQQDSATDTLRQIIVALVHVSTEHPEFHRLMLLESHEESPRLDWLFTRFARGHNKAMIEIIEAAQREGTIACIDPQRLLHAIVGMATISSQAAEFKKLTRKNLFSEREVQKTIDAINQLVFSAQQ